MSVSAAFALACLIGAPTTPAPSPAAKPEELIRLLGDKSYRVREGAARALIIRGSAAVPALTAATKDPDPEVSERARQLLPQAAAVERNEKLAILLKDPSAPPPKGLAGLDRFLRATGDSKESRELYAEMMSLHHATVEAAETNARAAADLFMQFGNEAYQKWQIGARTGRYSYENLFSGRADITYFLFLSADTRLRQYETGPNRSSILFSGTQISKAISEKEGTQAMRKLFLDWLEKEPQYYLQQRGFLLASQAGIKEALPLVLKLLDKKDRDAHSKANIMLALAKLGTKEHIKVLEPYMKDDTQVQSINLGNGPQLTIQVRDVAMGIQIQLAGQRLTEYGYDNRFGGGGQSIYCYGFPDDADNKSKARDEAHAKWKEWVKKNLPEAKEAKDAKDRPPVEAGPKPTEKK